MAEAERRRKQFRAALALAGKTQADFAVEHGVKPGHLSMVLSAQRDSARLMAFVESFIAKHLGEVAA
jgi:hypothetical protein